MGHAGHGFGSSHHYKPRPEFNRSGIGQLLGGYQTIMAGAALICCPWLWPFTYTLAKDHFAKRAQNPEAAKIDNNSDFEDEIERKHHDAFMDDWRRKYCGGR